MGSRSIVTLPMAEEKALVDRALNLRTSALTKKTCAECGRHTYLDQEVLIWPRDGLYLSCHRVEECR